MRPAHTPRRKLAAAILAGLAALASPGAARAAFIADSSVNIQGTASTSGPGFFTGNIAVDNVSKTQAVVQVVLTNTSPLANGGYITGFAFNLPGQIASATLTTAVPSSFTLIGGGSFNNTIGNYDDVPGSPYGYFDIGAAVGGDLLGGGSPNPGLAVNQTGTFQFTLTSTGNGYNLNNLTANLLMSLLSANPQGGGAQPFLVRFRGFNNGGSDKVIGEICDNNPPPPPPPGAVPAPPAVLLGLIGFGTCLLGRGFRRRVAAPATA
jgi:hypothetical protein